MYWEEMREYQFTGAIDNFGELCALPVSSLEKKGQHLPVGADGYIADIIIEEALKIEDTVIFPTSCWLGDVSAHPLAKEDGTPKWRGAIEISNDLQLTLFEEICDEIARNGFRKVLLIVKQPATAKIVGLFSRYIGYENRNYALLTTPAIKADISKAESVLNTIKERREDFSFVTEEDIKTLTKWVEDGIEREYVDTAILMARKPELVAVDRINAEDNSCTHKADAYLSDVIKFTNMQNIQYPNIETPTVPEGVTATIGEALIKINAERLADAFKLLKKDEECVRIATGVPMGELITYDLKEW